MDKYEYKIKAEEIKLLISQGRYDEAVEIADTIDWRRVKSVMMLCTISDLYKVNRRYEVSRDILLLAYDRHPGGRLIVYSLCELSIKLEEYVQAIQYYKEFVQVAPKDTGRYILQYKLYEAQDVSLEERIQVLEEFKRKDYREKWAYELAWLYHQVGFSTKCVEECDEIFLWFGEGRYVMKALELKELHKPLTEEQSGKYRKFKLGRTGLEEESQALKEDTPEEEPENDQEGIPEGIPEDIPGEDDVNGEYGRQEDENEPEIQVKTMDVSQYNTINLQKVLADSMKEVMDAPPLEDSTREAKQQEMLDPGGGQLSFEDMDTAQITSLFEDTDEIRLIAGEKLEKRETKPVNSQAVSQEVFFGDTAELNQGTEALDNGTEQEGRETVSEKTAARQLSGKPLTNEEGNQTKQPALDKRDGAKPLVDESQVQPKPLADESRTRPKPLADESQGGTTLAPEVSGITHTGIIRTFIKPSGYDDILAQEYDGQIKIVVPDSDKVEKQITGQISINDVMQEWERMKKENEQKRLDEIRKRVRKQTDVLFADFDESTKTGLLEKLEKVMVEAAIREEEERASHVKPKIVKLSEYDRTVIPAEEMVTAGSDGEEYSPEEEALLKEALQDIMSEEEKERAEEDIEPEMMPESMEEDPEGNETLGGSEPPESTEALEGSEPLGDSKNPDKPEESGETKPPDEGAGAEGIRPEGVLPEEEPESGKSGEGKAKDGSSREDQASGEADHVKGRDLTKEETEQFGRFLKHKKTKKQIAEAIDGISLASFTGNVIITGDPDAGTLDLAKLLLKNVQMADKNFTGKVARVSGANINKKDMKALLGKLSNGALLVDGASAMKPETFQDMLAVLNQEGQGMIVVLEDEKLPMNQLLEENSKAAEVFNLRVDMEALDDHALVEYAKAYAEGLEYSIDDLGILALHTRIADMQTSDHEVTVAEVEEIIDEAIYYADKKTPSHFFDILLGKRYDEEDMVILREKDFINY